MDISSTTSSAATMSTADTNVSTQAQKASDTSFKDEMDKVSTEKSEDTKKADSGKKVEGKSDKTNDKVIEKEQNSSQNQQISARDGENFNNNFDNNFADNFANDEQGMYMTGFQNGLANLDNLNGSSNIQTLMDANKQLESITTLSNDMQFAAKVDYTSIQMDASDAKFFSDLVQNTDATLQNLAADLQQGTEAQVQNAQKNVKVSATLMNALSDAVKNNQAVRIDFDQDVSVVLKIDKDGALSAKFIPGDQAVSEYLKQNISYLRQRFDEQELSYKELSYSDGREGQQQNRRNNKEKDNE